MIIFEEKKVNSFQYLHLYTSKVLETTKLKGLIYHFY